MTDTIYALASGSARGGVAVIRVSGPAALLTYKNLTNRPVPPARNAVMVVFRDPENEKILDRGMGLYFQAPHSFTGEDVVEYHVHGGIAVVQGFLNTLSKQAGCRLAEPGEFTRRAFENGKIDLTAAEAIADLVEAETEAQRVQALDQLGGSLSRLYTGWSDRLTKILAHQEAEIEFPEDDMPGGIAEELKGKIDVLKKEIAEHLNDARRGERLREGLRIAILGSPNAGKSSLLNALMRRDVAIVSDEAGTTRDVVEAHLNLSGYPVILADTAGLRETQSKVEAEGIRRARAAADDSDVKIVVVDGMGTIDPAIKALIDDKTIVVATKKDLGGKAVLPGAFLLSAQTGEGMEEFLKALTSRAEKLFASSGAPSLTRERHRTALQETLKCLERSTTAALPELAAEDLRLSLRALGGITGKVHVEELLDKIFRDFCIGK